MASSSSCSAARLKIAGAWNGTVDLELESWTLDDLKRELASKSGFDIACINLISGGKNLRGDGASADVLLKNLGLKNNSRLLMTRIGTEVARPVIEAKDRNERLNRIKIAADAITKRYSEDDFDLELENQSGEQLRFTSEDDKRALMMGLMLHAKAQKLMSQSQYGDALEVLKMAEESFSLCDPKLIEAVDNVALLHLDIVWCLFMLRDIARLAVARESLIQARQGLRKSHGENLERIHILQGGFTPELAIYVRLELLEGVVAYHSGQHEVARKSLISAQKKYDELQVSDEALAILAGMGFTAKESKRALRVSGQDMHRAVEFVMAEKARKKAKSEEDRKRQREHREQKKYGKTASGKPVDLKKLAELVSLGYDTRLAAESLRQSENDRESALDVLGNPALRDALQTSIKKKRLRRTVDEAELAELMLMGFEKERAGRALQMSLDVNEALEQLLRGEQSKPEEDASSMGPGTAGETARGTDSQPNSPTVDSPILEERDREMEAEIAENLTGDPYAEYDIEVDKEGVAILEYLSLLDVKAS